MKFIEQIKSIILFFLVLLSLILTFTIWSYTPNYQIIEENQAEEIKIGEEKAWQNVFKPYRLVIHENGYWTGSNRSSIINEIMTNLSSWQASELTFMQSNISDAKINDMIRTNERMTLFFGAEVPVGVFGEMFVQNEMPKITFKYLILDWSKLASSQSLQIYFVSEENRTLYGANIAINESYFETTILKAVKEVEEYQEIIRDGLLSLYVSQLEPEMMQYTYYIDEIAPDLLRDALFTDPSIVQKNIESLQSEKYTDGMSLMTADTEHKIINYVYPASESSVEISAVRLVQDSFEFVNEHGGFSGDYRYSSINARKHVTEYQLYMKGLPVFSNITFTRITTTWGDKQVFRYKRPYYLLEMAIPSEKVKQQLPSGGEIIKLLQQNRIQASSIDDLVLGYYLMQIGNNPLYTLVPSWFIIKDGSWTRVTSELLGGDEYGLE